MNRPYTFAYQPIISTLTNKVFSYEALIRGTNQEPPNSILSKVLPDQQTAFDFTAAQQAVNQAVNLGLNCHINLNFFPNSLLNIDYIFDFIKFIQTIQIPCNRIIVELTEAEVIHQTDNLHSSVKLLRKAGMQIAIDDFGAGYSGLNLLVSFQPQIIKLDMQLIRDIDQLGPKQAVVKAILNVCTSLGIEVIAEGIETIEEFQWLKKQNIELYQGYLFAKPGFQCLPAKPDWFNFSSSKILNGETS